MNTMPAIGVNISVVLFGCKISCRTEIQNFRDGEYKDYSLLRCDDHADVVFVCQRTRLHIPRNFNHYQPLLFLLVCGWSRDSIGG